MVVVVLCMTTCRKKERWRPEKSQNGPCFCNKRGWKKKDRWGLETTEHGEGIVCG
jgi:hypothetical protein